MLLSALCTLRASDRLSALTSTELNPHHGAEDGSTLRAFVDSLAHALVVSPLLV